MAHMAGIAGPTRFSDFRHARKSITFDGSAGGGASGTPVDVFTITGRVLVASLTIYCSADLTTSGAAIIGCGTATYVQGIVPNTTATTIDTPLYWNSNSPDTLILEAITQTLGVPGGMVLSEDVILTIGTANVTGGTLIFDIWYQPITDDGALVAA